MNTEQYKALSNRLRSMEDVKKIAREEGIDEELLLVIYTQRVTRNATKSFYRVKAKVHHLLREWEEGRPLIILARRHRFPPVLMAYIIMMERNIGRKTFWKYVRGPDTIPNKRLKREIKEIVQNDNIYSPGGSDVQAERGRHGEARGAELLDRFNISYLTEKELRGQSTKTPDFLLHKPLVIDGRLVNWIESKANFGDLVEVRRNNMKQLKPYVKLFGPGLVVYWFGFVDDAPQDKDIMMVDGEFMEEVLSKKHWGGRCNFKAGAESPTSRLKDGTKTKPAKKEEVKATRPSKTEQKKQGSKGQKKRSSTRRHKGRRGRKRRPRGRKQKTPKDEKPTQREGGESSGRKEGES